MKFRCFDQCSLSGDTYYGLMWGNQCECGSVKPDDSNKKADSHCGTACPGDPSAKCGGPGNSINLYQISPTTTMTPVESPIVNTFHSSVAYNGDSSKLVDNQGLDGNYDG